MLCSLSLTILVAFAEVLHFANNMNYLYTAVNYMRLIWMRVYYYTVGCTFVSIWYMDVVLIFSIQFKPRKLITSSVAFYIYDMSSKLQVIPTQDTTANDLVWSETLARIGWSAKTNCVSSGHFGNQAIKRFPYRPLLITPERPKCLGFNK